MKTQSEHNRRSFKVTYLPATDTQAGRISISEPRCKQRKTLHFERKLTHRQNALTRASIGWNDTINLAWTYLESIGIQPEVWSDFGDCYVILSNSWSHKSKLGFIDLHGKTTN